jgi:hypothetical protein
LVFHDDFYFPDPPLFAPSHSKSCSFSTHM